MTWIAIVVAVLIVVVGLVLLQRHLNGRRDRMWHEAAAELGTTVDTDAKGSPMLWTRHGDLEVSVTHHVALVDTGVHDADRHEYAVFKTSFPAVGPQLLITGERWSHGAKPARRDGFLDIDVDPQLSAPGKVTAPDPDAALRTLHPGRREPLDAILADFRDIEVTESSMSGRYPLRRHSGEELAEAIRLCRTARSASALASPRRRGSPARALSPSSAVRRRTWRRRPTPRTK